MVKSLLIQSISDPFHNLKSLEMWRSLFSVTTSRVPPHVRCHHPSQHSLSHGNEAASPFSHRNGNINSKYFRQKNKYPFYFPNQKADPPPLLQGPSYKNTGKHRYRYTEENTNSATENKPTFSKHLESMLISRISPSFGTLNTPSVSCARI